MPFNLKRVVDDQLKHLQWFVMGAVQEHFDQQGNTYCPEKHSVYYQDTLNKVIQYLMTGNTSGSYSDFQCHVALEARKLFNPTPIGYVTGGSLEHTYEGQLVPNLANGIENEQQARFWMDECGLRVHPVYVGPAIN